MGMIMKNGVPYAQGSKIPKGGTKGQVLAKASNISGDFEWANGGGGGTFVAEYGVTTFDELKAAYDAGNVCLVRYEDSAGSLTQNCVGLLQDYRERGSLLEYKDFRFTCYNFYRNTAIRLRCYQNSYAGQEGWKEPWEMRLVEDGKTYFKVYEGQETDEKHLLINIITDFDTSADPVIAVEFSAPENTEGRNVCVPCSTYRPGGYDSEGRRFLRLAGVYDENLVTFDIAADTENNIVLWTDRKIVPLGGGSDVIFDVSQNILASELNAAYAKGPIYLKYSGNFYPVASVAEEGSNYYIGTTSGSGRSMTFYFDYYGTYLEFAGRVDTHELYGDLTVPNGSTTATFKKNLSQVQLVGNNDVVQYKVKGGKYAEQTFNLATTQYVQDHAGGMNFEVGVERWCGTYTEDGVTYQMYSKIIKIGALPATAGITTYQHGITGIKQILQVFGFTTDGFVMNAPRQNVQDVISVFQTSKALANQTISVEVGKDRSSKQGYVGLIYAKSN